MMRPTYGIMKLGGAASLRMALGTL